MMRRPSDTAEHAEGEVEGVASVRVKGEEETPTQWCEPMSCRVLIHGWRSCLRSDVGADGTPVSSRCKEANLTSFGSVLDTSFPQGSSFWGRDPCSPTSFGYIPSWTARSISGGGCPMHSCQLHVHDFPLSPLTCLLAFFPPTYHAARRCLSQSEEGSRSLTCTASMQTRVRIVQLHAAWSHLSSSANINQSCYATGSSVMFAWPERYHALHYFVNGSSTIALLGWNWGRHMIGSVGHFIFSRTLNV